MLGKVSDLKFDRLDAFYGEFSASMEIQLQLIKWRAENPEAVIIQIQYGTYSAGNGWGETALIIFKVGEPA